MNKNITTSLLLWREALRMALKAALSKVKKYSGRLLLLSFLMLAAYSMKAQTTETFSSSGTWTCPAGVTMVTVECWGGGGGGGRALGFSYTNGGGGGGGAYAKSIIPVTPGNTYTVNVGTGGLGGQRTGNTTINGLNGGDSWFISDTTILAKGGAGGNGGTSAISGVGGSGSSMGLIGTTVYAGGSGAAGVNGSSNRSGGGGGSAGSMGAGGNASVTSVTGGAAGAGGGATGAAGRTTNGNGISGSAPGSGGGGGRTNSGTGYFGGNGGNGRVKLTPIPPPSNDEAMGAVMLSANNDNNCAAATPGTTLGATQSADIAPECMAASIEDDVWYSFVATAAAHRITFTGATFAMAGAVYAGSPGLLTVVPSACADDNSLTVIGLTPNTAYYIRAYTAFDGSTTSDFNICVGVPEIPPANDDCSGAIAIGSIPYSNTQTLLGSATQTAFQGTCSSPMNDGVWYTFTGTGNDIKITADPAGNHDLAIGLYSGSSCTALSCIEIDNDASTGGTENYTFASAAGTIYYINIGYPSGTANGEEGSFTLSLENLNGILTNDDADSAIVLTPGAGCTFFSNTGATAATGEPTASCMLQNPMHPVWFKFVAPMSGAVRISSDNGGSLIANGTRMGIFDVTDSSNYSTFSLIHCSGASGVTQGGSNIFYPTRLTPGATYYLVLDVYDTSSQGIFCITVDELDTSMISTTMGDCVDGMSMGTSPWTGTNGNYHEWVSLVDAQGKLNANIRQVSGNANTFSSSRTIKTGALRTDGVNGKTYMNRNYRINSNGGSGTTSADLQLFFTTAELMEMGVNPTALNVTRVAGTTCNADFVDSSEKTLLTQTTHASMNGVHMIQVNAPGFSNFFIHAGNTPLPLELISFVGRYRNGSNILQWETAAETGLSHFELQRSGDGKQFEPVGNTKAKGEKSNRYTFSDNSILAGSNMYRLKMTDADGSFNYSNTIEVSNSLNNDFTMTAGPNPVKDLLHVSFKGNMNQPGYLQIIDLYGKTVFKTQPKADNITIDMRMLPAGNYYVRYTDAVNTKTIKIVKN